MVISKMKGLNPDLVMVSDNVAFEFILRHRVLLNIFINAAQAMSDEGDIYLETRNMVLSDTDVSPPGIRAGR